MSDQEELIQAIKLIRRGDHAAGGQILHRLLAADNNPELAWLWMAACMQTPEDKRACLEEVLRINPNHPAARRELAQLGFSPERRAPPSPREAAQRAERFKRLTGARSASASAAAPSLKPRPEPPISAADREAQESPAPAPKPSAEPEWLSLSEPVPAAPSVSTIPAQQPAAKPPTPQTAKPRPPKPAQPSEKPAPQRTAAPAPAVRRGLSRWAVPAGLAFIFLVVMIWLMLVFASGGGGGVPQTKPASAYQIEYIVTGTAAQAKVTYYNAANRLEAWNVTQLPFAKTLTFPGENTPRIQMTVQNLTNSGTIGCEIKINGVSQTTNTNDAPRGLITCSALTPQ